MSHPVVHAEIRSSDPDATRGFFAKLFGWDYSDGAFPGYSFVGSGAEGGPPTAIATLNQAQELGGRIVQPAQEVPGVTFGVLADQQGHLIGVAAQT
jgi:predicted enzyme related to lactoylglutathione lyase